MSETEIVKASELEEKVIDRIFELRNPTVRPEHEKALAKYRRRLGKRQEVEGTIRDGMFQREATGFYILKNGEPVFVERPKLGREVTYGYSGYDRSWGIILHAREYGLLTSPQLNRNIRPERES